eukprot:TRINITY_DN1973_c0_g1_i1.p1 TRINITY_DN1973_c0_g1~~TRINITY_DN1973_c0_g1_i1.p1  ORF type:complete len:223 (+),score=54.67 TRINITY_DN1973_c0_g1_i1:113-781(+)
MPKSKRAKIVSLTKTPKRRQERKGELVLEVQKAAREYKHIWVIHHHGVGNITMKEVRRRWGTSRFFLGKNKVMAVALGRDEESELLEGVSKLSERISGQCALLFTDQEPQEVEEFFSDYKEMEYCKAGEKAPQTIVLPAGIQPQFSHAIEPHLRKLGLHTKLKMGEVDLLKETTVCTEGETLSPEQCQILRLYEYKISEFFFTIDCHYNTETAEFRVFPSAG